jgi:hypothetical protein
MPRHNAQRQSLCEILAKMIHRISEFHAPSRSHRTQGATGLSTGDRSGGARCPHAHIRRKPARSDTATAQHEYRHRSGADSDPRSHRSAPVSSYYYQQPNQFPVCRRDVPVSLVKVSIPSRRGLESTQPPPLSAPRVRVRARRLRVLRRAAPVAAILR